LKNKKYITSPIDNSISNKTRKLSIFKNQNIKNKINKKLNKNQEKIQNYNQETIKKNLMNIWKNK